MANNLPNPFQSASVPPVVNSTAKTSQNDTSFFYGYRSNFDINQQKEEYQQRMSQQQSNNQKPQFNRNIQQRSNRTDRGAPSQDVDQTNGSYVSNWCDLCERGFKFPYQLEKHRDEHEKCWFDNCNFEGHSKLLQKHIETQHQSGLFQRIGKVETEEDIEKWREERRKRYPTKANIEARRMAQEERLKRGERIEEPNHRFGDFKNRKSAQHRAFTQDQNDSNKNQMGKKKNRRRTRNKNKNKINKREEIESGKNGNEKTTNKPEEMNKKNETTGTVNGNESTAPSQYSIKPEDKVLQNTNALAAIMGMYGSDSDSDCDDEETPVTEIKTTESQSSGTATNITTPEKTLETEQPMPESNELTATPSDDPIDGTNLKRSISFSDELPAKQPKVDSDVNENFKPTPEDESDDEAPEEQPVQRKSGDSEQNDDAESGPTKTKPEQKQALNDRAPKRRTILDMTRKVRNQNTLLEKLLQKDIRHERNVLLQCVRYVIENNFFGIGQKIDEENNQVESA